MADLAPSRLPAPTEVAPGRRPGHGAEPPGGRPRWRPDLALVALALVMLGATAVRVLGTGWGLPAQLHPDEPVVVVSAVDMATRNSFEPSVFHRPDHTEIQLSNIAYIAYVQLRGDQPVEEAFAAHPATFYQISRLITCAFGVGSVLLAYLIGRRFDRWTGVLAAALVGFFPPLVTNSFYATPDVPLTFFLLGVVLFSMRYLERWRWIDLLLACAFVSLSAATKYPGAMFGLVVGGVVLAGAVRRRSWTEALARGFASVAAFVGFLFLISPVLFTDVGEVVHAVVGESRQHHLGADGLGWGGNLLFYAGEYLTAGGLIVALLTVLGVVVVVRRRQWIALPLGMSLVFWVVLSALPLHWDRWGLPMFVGPLLMAAVGAREALAWIGRRTTPIVLRWIGGVALGISAVNLMAGALVVLAEHRAPDSRVAGQGILAAAGVTPENAASEAYTPERPSAVGSFQSDLVLQDGRLVTPDPATRYAVTSSNVKDRFRAARELYPVQNEVYDLLEHEEIVEQIRTVAPHRSHPLEAVNLMRVVAELRELADGGLTGPEITVYRLSDDG